MFVRRNCRIGSDYRFRLVIVIVHDMGDHELGEMTQTYFFVVAENLICIGRLGHLLPVDIFHAPNIFLEITPQRSVDRSIVNRNKRRNQIRRLESYHHSCFGTPGSFDLLLIFCPFFPLGINENISISSGRQLLWRTLNVPLRHTFLASCHG